MKNNAITKACLIMLSAAFMHIQALSQSIVAAGYSFSASQKTYTYLTGGTSLPNVEVDDGYDVITIFPFRFCGNTYTDLVLCSNGWMKFGTQPTWIDPWMNQNQSLSQGQYPCIYPLYEDINGDIGTSSYKITGTYPNRVFVWECRDFKWDFDAPDASVSFQVWLFEATGVIECLYKQEAGSVALNSSGGATIGIANSQTDWQTLDNSGASPTSSSTVYTSNIGSRPATGQSYIWDPGPTCPQPLTPVLNFINSTYADISWSAPAGAQGYEYFIDENATPPATGMPTAITTPGVTKGSLKPGTVYYLHVRTKCGTYNFSTWLSYKFETLPPCAIPPPGISKTKIDSNSAELTWKGGTTFLNYEYFIKADPSFPTSSAGSSSTTNNGLSLKPLISGTTYYIFLRVKCQGNDSSAWMLDSFYVPYPCRPPVIQFNDLNSARVVAFWGKQPSAYEYELLTSSAPVSDPQAGIKIAHNSYHIPFLNASKQYYVYARSHCDDRGIRSVSDWSETSFTTWALGVEEAMSNVEMTVHPNPVTDVLIVNNLPGKGTITIYDLNGRLINTVICTTATVEINVNSLAKGVYTVRYQGDKEVRHTKFNKL